MQKNHALCSIFSLLLLLMVCIPGGVLAEGPDEIISEPEETQTPVPSDPILGLIYNGTVDVKSSISVVADSGISYTIPGNTPIGVLEVLMNSGAIEELSIGDELMEKKGTLLLYGIGNLSSGNGNGWFVKVNGERLEDVVLAETMGLSRYTLKEGDVVLYTLGDPKGMVSESKAYLTVTIGMVDEAEPEPVKEPSAVNTSEENDESAEITDINTDTKPQQSDDEAEHVSDETPEDQKPEKTTSGGQEVIYTGSMSLPSGTITIETTGGDYDINAATPLGILHELLEDDKISDLTVSDKAMKKGGILILEGINDYQFTGDKTWFVLVNNVLLKDYLYDEEGLNIYKIKAGDEVGYYFGEPSEPASAAQVKLVITIE
ncbi:hypothetical protein Mhun_1577 [Methanospirillum hungatei JF-1]|uniref:DUF4430 domain-containing protein n=1 Tax=Methanospirillum hungatei JF-1 (strain ATCC 27890 / DSM 864 / NBRC 100397 / JF-1) TaxID=323259 RepID=Q2FRA4_METHJ|nr:hypothetical protein [Methanospirillum hungatei]ABD41308.1 hypothetical protein Mhun_1577 [Methanospirillum hungatei JF-1]